MMKDDKEFIRHISKAIKLIENDTVGETKDSTFKDATKRDAIIYRLIIIGEAAKNISQIFKEGHPDIDWKGLTGIRDVMAHKYFSIDFEIVWSIITRELPILDEQIDKILES